MLFYWLGPFCPETQKYVFTWANPGLFLCFFSSFQHLTIQIQIDKSVDGVLGIQTRGSRTEGPDESTKLRWQPLFSMLMCGQFISPLTCLKADILSCVSTSMF